MLKIITTTNMSNLRALGLTVILDPTDLDTQIYLNNNNNNNNNNNSIVIVNCDCDCDCDINKQQH
jgi:hypothetical protein